MNIIPAIDLQDGRVVQLVGGDPRRIGAAPDNSPTEQAALWRAAGARLVHVVDLDAALGGARQWQHLDGILGVGPAVQFGGGVRSMLDVQRLVDLGVARVIIGTQGVQNPAWLRELCILWPGRIILAVDAYGRNVAVKGWTEKTGLDVVELARTLDDAGLAGFLYTNVEREGSMRGIDTEVIQDLVDAAPNTPVIASGGIASLDDLDTLAGLGVQACVLGMSIYTGAIDLAEALRRFAVEAPA